MDRATPANPRQLTVCRLLGNYIRHVFHISLNLDCCFKQQLSPPDCDMKAWSAGSAGGSDVLSSTQRPWSNASVFLEIAGFAYQYITCYYTCIYFYVCCECVGVLVQKLPNARNQHNVNHITVKSLHLLTLSYTYQV